MTPPETPETATEVPEAMVHSFARGFYGENWVKLWDDDHDGRDIANGLAAVLPAHEAMVRADERRKAIEAINAKRDAIACNCADDRILRNGLWLATRILEGEQP